MPRSSSDCLIGLQPSTTSRLLSTVGWLRLSKLPLHVLDSGFCCPHGPSFTSSLTDDEWTAPSAAAGWRIADVVAHIGATARNSYTPAGLRTTFAAGLEQLNEDPVDRRRDWSRADVMAEYQRASRRAPSRHGAAVA